MDLNMSDSKIKNICVVLPTYNEAENIKTAIDQIFSNQKQLDNYRLNVLVVDDNSPDNTKEIVQQLMATYPNLTQLNGDKKGLGDAYKRGINFALKNLDADLIVQMDADGQHDPSLIASFIKMTEKYDVIIGSRFIEGASTPYFSYRRIVMSRVGNLLVRYLGGAYVIKDCTSGYRIIRKEVLEKCELSAFPTKGYSFQSWLICELLRKGAVIKEVPIIFKKRLAGDSKLSFEDQLEFLINIVRIRFANSEEFVNYCLVGASGVVVNLSVYYSLTRFLDINVLLSSPMAIEASLLTNFLLHNYWTFRDRQTKKNLVSRLLSFHVVSGVAGLINYTMFVTLISLLLINDILAVLFGIGAGIVFNYTGNSLWTFRKKIKKPKVIKR